MQYPANANTFGDNVANNSQDWLWYNWAGNYYYSNAYRGQVRDKVQGAYDRWGSGSGAAPALAAEPAVPAGTPLMMARDCFYFAGFD